MIVKMQLLTPVTPDARRRRPQGSRTAVLLSRCKIQGFWEITEPEIMREFECRDYAFFEVEPIGKGELGCQECKVIRRVEDEDW